MPDAWATQDDPDEALERVLDAAGRCFAARGIRSTTLSDVAREAGCSRPTVYRYVAGRDALRVAYIRREARRLGERIRADADAGLVVDLVMAALRGVRSDPTLAAWFTPDDVGTTLALALSPDLVADLAAAITMPAPGDGAGAPPQPSSEAAAWTVRVILSLLANPAADEATERRLVERFVVPVVGPTLG